MGSFVIYCDAIQLKHFHRDTNQVKLKRTFNLGLVLIAL